MEETTIPFLFRWVPNGCRTQWALVKVFLGLKWVILQRIEGEPHSIKDSMGSCSPQRCSCAHFTFVRKNFMQNTFSRSGSNVLPETNDWSFPRWRENYFHQSEFKPASHAQLAKVVLIYWQINRLKSKQYLLLMIIIIYTFLTGFLSVAVVWFEPKSDVWLIFHQRVSRLLQRLVGRSVGERTNKLPSINFAYAVCSSSDTSLECAPPTRSGAAALLARGSSLLLTAPPSFWRCFCCCSVFILLIFWKTATSLNLIWNSFS